MSTKIQAKSILKQQPIKKTLTAADEQRAKLEADRKNLNIALRHAHLIQHRKDVEAKILDSITTLIEFPREYPVTAEEATAFVALVDPFQPSDFDSLVEERCIDGKCGYGLCVNPPRSQFMGGSVAWKLNEGMGDWCSDSCAEKGLFIKAQLSEIPSWERSSEQQPGIQLHADDSFPEVETAMRRAKRTARVDQWRQKVANEDELAMERGEKPSSFKPKQVMKDTIVEKKPGAVKISNSPIGTYNAIEGYEPERNGEGYKGVRDGSDDDDEVN